MAGQLFRKGTNIIFKELQVNSEIGSGFFPKMLPLYVCNSVSNGQNIQNEISLERSIFADVVVYQLINLT